MVMTKAMMRIMATMMTMIMTMMQKHCESFELQNPALKTARCMTASY